MLVSMRAFVLFGIVPDLKLAEKETAKYLFDAVQIRLIFEKIFL